MSVRKGKRTYVESASVVIAQYLRKLFGDQLGKLLEWR